MPVLGAAGWKREVVRAIDRPKGGPVAATPKTEITMKPLLVAGILLPLAACVTPDEKPIGTPNPASVHCESKGGRVEIRNETGGSVGYCHLPDGRVVEEWTLFRADNR